VERYVLLHHTRVHTLSHIPIIIYPIPYPGGYEGMAGMGYGTSKPFSLYTRAPQASRTGKFFRVNPVSWGLIGDRGSRR